MKQFRLADLIEQNKTVLANLEVLDNGKPFAEADFDIQCTVDTFRYYAGWCDKIHGNTIPAGEKLNQNLLKSCHKILMFYVNFDFYITFTDGGSLAITQKEPVGVVGQIVCFFFLLIYFITL